MQASRTSTARAYSNNGVRIGRCSLAPGVGTAARYEWPTPAVLPATLSDLACPYDVRRDDPLAGPPGLQRSGPHRARPRRVVRLPAAARGAGTGRRAGLRRTPAND